VLMPLASVESLPFRALLTLLLNPHGTTGDWSGLRSLGAGIRATPPAWPKRSLRVRTGPRGHGPSVHALEVRLGGPTRSAWPISLNLLFAKFQTMFLSCEKLY
jgi:hypothetical protein